MKSIVSARMTVIHNMIEQKTKRQAKQKDRRNTYFTRIFGKVQKTFMFEVKV
jgi:hypothetical protein